MAGLMIAVSVRMERRHERRMDQQEERANQQEIRLTQRIDRLENEMKRQYESLDARLRIVEENQARLSGEVATLREAILLQTAARE